MAYECMRFLQFKSVSKKLYFWECCYRQNSQKNLCRGILDALDVL